MDMTEHIYTHTYPQVTRYALYFLMYLFKCFLLGEAVNLFLWHKMVE